MLKRLITHKAYLLIGYAFFLIIHFILKDRVKIFIAFFNACPLILIILYGFYTAIRIRKQKLLALSLIVFNIILSVYWYQNYFFKPKATTSNKATLSVLYWNVAKRDHIPLPIIFNQIKTNQPEIVALVEAKHKTIEAVDAFKIYAPEYEVKILDAEMMIAIKGKIDSIQFHQVGSSSKFNYIASQINNRAVNIMITDLLASPTHSKKSDLFKVKTFADSHNIDCIVGDFNTPFESYYFKYLDGDHESFHKYTNGYTATWPSFFPVLEIDHVWVSNKWQPVILNKAFFKESDHALLHATFQLK